MDDLGYTKKINWNDISMPYAPNWYINETQKQEKFKNIQLLLGDALDIFIKKNTSKDNFSEN